MRKIITLLLACLAAICIALPVEAKVERRFASTPVTSEGETFHVDSIDFRADLTRVYGKLMGTPHTSGKIDVVELETGGKKMVADDIDGIDFGRYYQYEDEGVIELEVDFPAMKSFQGAVIIFSSPRTQQKTRITRR
ncbi:MAG: hypothetical protein K2K55_06030 [Duncaniella sp.]|nr:hypothetical protein [Duncaniella sp.]